MIRPPSHADRALILNRILAAWDHDPTLRLGQLLMAAIGWQNLPHVEDEALAARVEEFVVAGEKWRSKP